MQFTKTTILAFALLAVSASALPVEQVEQAGGNAVQQGINKNIQVQNKEQSDVKGVAKTESKNGGNPGFGAAKSQLQGDIKQGQTIRQGNQKLAQQTQPQNKQLQQGLDKVQKAQGTESKQAASLNGVSSHDSGTVKKLGTEISGGIKQNQQNAKAAGKGH